jgi:peptidoglycan/xylan/chitin deacetylase (PgdA/CDA1 family)
MRALLLADLAQQLVGRRVAGGALVEIVDLLVLGGLARRQQPVDGGDPRLQAEPQPRPHGDGVGHLDPERAHPLLERPAVAALGLRHPLEDLGLAVGHPPRDQLIHRAGDDLSTPPLEQAVANLDGGVSHTTKSVTPTPLALPAVPSTRKRSLMLAAAVSVLALAGSLPLLAGCGGSSKPAATSTSRSDAITPGAGRGSSEPPVAKRSVPALIPPANPPQRSVQVPVLTYHRVVSLPAVGQLDLIVDPANFAAELAAIRSGGYHTITQAQLFDALYKGARLPAKPIIISVDDGYVDDVRTILPDLKRMHMVATFFVITGRTSEPGFVDANQIRELDRAGMDVGDHTAHHVDLRQITPSELQMETAGSRKALERMLGHPVYAFAYPFGAFDDAVVSAVHAAGFTLAYTTAGGSTESTSAPLTMPRIHVGRSETPSGVVSLLGGG